MFIAIEGIDGSGKGTQAELLHQRFLREGLKSAKFAFPQYGRTAFAEAIGEYLNGEFGGLDAVHPKLISVLYAADRFAAKELLMDRLNGGIELVCDRYVASNMAHQAAKLHEGKRAAFIEWLSSVEYGAFGLPKADVTIYLDMPVDAANELVHRKSSRSQDIVFSEGKQGGYTTLKEDIHEADKSYLSRCREVYDLLIRDSVGGRWAPVQCLNEQGEIRPQEEIGDEVWRVVSGTKP